MLRNLARSVTPRAAGVVFLLVALCAVAASTSLAASPPSPPVRHTGGFVPPIHGGVKPQDNCPPSGCGSGKLIYHGGPTMTTNKVYTVFWGPSNAQVPASYVNTLNQFFQDVATDSGMPTNVYASDTQYSSILYSSTFGGTFTDTAAFPSNGCTPYGTGAIACLSDGQLQSELNKVITQQGWVKSSTNMFFIFTPKNVESCDPGNGCTFTTYCAYHGSAGGMIYANMPYAVTTIPQYNGFCDVGQYPNGNDADATINVTSHEHNEAITDPTLTAWYDQQGYENGDKCAWTFGSLSGSSPGQYNQTINGHHYFLQEEFSNDTGSNGQCVQTHSIAGGGGSGPQIGSFSPTSGPVGTAVDIQGSNFTGATSVKFNGTPDPTFQVNSATDISAHVPTGATSGTISVATPQGTGTSSTSFTVTSTSAPVVSSFSPTSGPVGTNVTINGSGFTGATAVTFGGVAATNFTVNSDVLIHANVPTGAQTGPIGVTTQFGPGTSSTSFTVTVQSQPPHITGFTPTSGYPGYKVKIMGTNLSGVTTVRLGSVSASFTINSSTQITATVPTEPRLGSYKWSVSSPAGSSVSISYFRYL
jgi:hypothetical protein